MLKPMARWDVHDLKIPQEKGVLSGQIPEKKKSGPWGLNNPPNEGTAGSF
jgi:hypothetical protein